MERAAVLGTLVFVGTISIVAAAIQQPPAGGQEARVVNVEKVKDNLFVLREGGGNTAIFVQADGVTVVDTKLPGWGKPILDAIKALTNKPVTMIINTHTHGDHVSGNVEFPASVAVVTHENTKDNMTRMASPFQQAKPAANIFVENKGRGMPTRVFEDRLSLGKGDDQVDLFYFGRGHTNGDTMIVFPSLRVMHMGDLFPGKNIPIMDPNNGGSGVAYSETLRKTHDGVKNVDTIITGHSTLMTPKDLLEYSEFIRDFVEAVRAGKEAGQSAEQIAGSWKVPEKYTGYTAADPKRLLVNVEFILKELQ